MRLFVLHDARGNVLAVVKANVLQDSEEHPFSVVGAEERVLEIKPSRELEALACHEIYELYKLDVKAKALKPRAARERAPGRARGRTTGPARRRRR